ncbi:MAG TPA: polyphosphate:AMP phosphotransferase [Gemmatimonadales bacterium]
MFQTAEVGRRVADEDYRARLPELREQLLDVQARLRDAPFPVILLLAGVDGAGKGDVANMLHEWMDPHWIVTRAFSEPTVEESERPRFWRFWRDLPPNGHIGVFLSAWYSLPLVQRALGKISAQAFDDRLDEVAGFERTLANDGALVLKFWMHLGRLQQKERLDALSADPNQSWRVTDRDWKHLKKYTGFAAAGERIIQRTSSGEAPWDIVEGTDGNFRRLEVATVLRDAIAGRLNEAPATRARPSRPVRLGLDAENPTILSTLDLDSKLSKSEYEAELERLQAKLARLHREAHARGVSTICVFEGWDAAGKGGAIRRLTGAIEARHYHVIMIAAPTEEERSHHYLWRFWRHLPRAGRVTIFDRSWYGRVLVERIEGFAHEDDWRRAYGEINDFEQQLTEYGIVLVKFWLHISKAEQKKRFKARAKIPFKRWKLTEEDKRNRAKWDLYELAVHDMVERTSTGSAPWTLVEGNDKRYARIKVLTTVTDRLETALG